MSNKLCQGSPLYIGKDGYLTTEETGERVGVVLSMDYNTVDIEWLGSRGWLPGPTITLALDAIKIPKPEPIKIKLCTRKFRI